MKNHPRIPIIITILTNLIPLLGVLFYEWKIFNIIFLYWFEFFIIGIFLLIKSSSSFFASIKSGFYRFFIFILISNFLYFSFIVIFFVPYFLNNTSYLPTFLIGLKNAFIFGVYSTWSAIISLVLGNLYTFINEKKYAENSERNFTGKLVSLHLVLLLIGSIASRFPASQIIILLFLILFKTSIDLKTHTISIKNQVAEYKEN